MTQKATGEALLAPFEGESLRTLGFVATMTGGAAGRPHILVEDEATGEVLLDVDVELTVGSHRYQQYVAKWDRGGGPEERWRLPLAWHPETQRWIHLSGAFLTPDGEPGRPEDYLRHLSRWSDNCIFCHNTEVSPGLGPDGIWEPEIAELGIACEACHGKASEHVARYEDPRVRLMTAVAERPADNTVAHPGRLGPAREADVCGRCHGQRIARDIATVMADGDPFVPGEPLSEVSRPILRDSEVEGLPPRPFAERFWPDGTPRLSAYEYQGLLLSPCHDEGRGLSCASCHTMHGEQPDGQLRPDYSASSACGTCHSTATLGDAHGGHADPVDCVDCHMPAVTYGLLQGMLSHRVTTPDPGAWVGRHDQPDACTQCHVDQTRAWAAESMDSLGLRGTAAAPAAAREQWASRVVLDLLGGDPVQRTLAAHALAQSGATGATKLRARWLTAGLADEYPAVRWMAWRGLTELVAAPALADYDFMGPLSERLRVEQTLRAQLGEPPLSGDDRLATLADERDAVAIWIGE